MLICLTLQLLKPELSEMIEDKSLVGHFRTLVESSDNILITTHTNPDGDAIGSSLALYHLLDKLGIESKVLIPNYYPSFLNWMPGIGDLVIFDKEAAIAKELIEEAKLVFCLDYNGLSRSGVLQEDLAKSNAPKVLIDHHPEPEIQAFTHFYYNTKKASTAGLVFNLICDLGLKESIDREIAECLFVGIMTDTGSFSHAINDPEVFRSVADLLELGLDANNIHRLIYDTFSENRLRLLGHAITNRMIVLNDYHTAIIQLSKEDLKQFDFQIGDTEGIVNYPLSMENINLAVLLTEKKDLVRLSFRSKGDFSVNEMAREHFKGGGHLNAAGGNSELSLKETFNKLLAVLPAYRQLLKF